MHDDCNDASVDCQQEAAFRDEDPEAAVAGLAYLDRYVL